MCLSYLVHLDIYRILVAREVSLQDWQQHQCIDKCA